MAKKKIAFIMNTKISPGKMQIIAKIFIKMNNMKLTNIDDSMVCKLPARLQS